MKAIRDQFRLARSTDAGLSLVEVIIAIAIVSVVALASAALTGNGLATAAAQSRQQIAVTIASGQMEKVSGWNVAQSALTGVSGLYTGRPAAKVSTAFATYNVVPGVSDTAAKGDPTATSCPTAPAPCGAIPISQTVTEGGTSYTVATLIGQCYQSTVVSTATPPLPDQCTNPVTPPANATPLIRAIVIVTWTAGSRCAASGCSYQASTLIDPHTDLLWVTH